jgi:hypothetical protein
MAYRYIGGYWDTVIRHYEFKSDHFAKTKGYEHYGKMTDMIDRHGSEGLTDFFVNLQVWGTPQQCLEKIIDIRSRVGCDSYIAVPSFAAMPIEDAERSLRLFAREVMPELRKLDADVPAAAVAAR